MRNSILGTGNIKNQFLNFLRVPGKIGALLFIAAFAVPAMTQISEPKVTPLTWQDQQDLKNKVAIINEVARTKLGTEIHEDQSDIQTLQRVVDGRFIDPDDTMKLQATGVVLGNLIKKELENLKWMVYEDSQGRSRALCVTNTNQCLFPTTMISRRVEVDATVDVQAIYDNAYALIKPYVDAAHPYQPSKLVRPEYKSPEQAPREPSKNINVQFE